MMSSKTKIDGPILKKMMVTAADKIYSNKELINAINVFPIKDGDTGTNLYLTIKKVIEQFEGNCANTLTETAQLISKGSFLGAKGNSGVIISQFFQGFSAEIEENEEIDIEDFARALEEGAEWAYDAVLNPQEGTILTVIRDTANKAREIANTNGDWEEMITKTYKTALESLENTPNLLPVLKEAEVVDAGAKGFVSLWLGWCFVLIDSLGLKLADIQEEFAKFK